ncbi:TMOD1 [Cordylochernes scorpioides]|uniref:TMOD1 n=1 Tax=Cordylochernes scorpioides TaxID=51811 RepID=A0ABY6K0I2_9ARAC|nr:TMOD1 [Cordylochernes scorpioides]
MQVTNRSSSTFYTTTKTAKYFGKTLDELTLDELLDKLTPEELEILESEVDPDDPHIPPNQRCKDQTKKAPTGPLNRRKLLQYLEKYAKEQEDWPEQQPFQLGMKRGKIWIPKESPKPKIEEVELDLDQEYEVALNSAEEHELVDLAVHVQAMIIITMCATAILGLHSMLSQDQYHTTQLSKQQKKGDKFDGLVKAAPLKILPPEPDNDTDVEATVRLIANNDPTLTSVNLNNIKYTTTKTAKYFGKTLDELTLDELLDKLTPEELEILESEVDPDDPHIPPNQRCKDQTKKAPTGPLNRRKLLQYLEKYAKEQEDWPEQQPFQLGMKRGRRISPLAILCKIWIPKESPKPKIEEVELDLDQEYEVALNSAEEHELVDLAGWCLHGYCSSYLLTMCATAILGLHSMLSQDQYHTTQLSKQQKKGDKFDGLVKAAPLKILPPEPDNDTDVEATVRLIANNDPTLTSVNLNNIKNISRETFKKLFEGLKKNTHLKLLSAANTGLTDGPVQMLVDALKQNKSLERLNVESNYLTGPTLASLLEALLPNQTVLEFRAANQLQPLIHRPNETQTFLDWTTSPALHCITSLPLGDFDNCVDEQRPFLLGNRVEMEVARLILKNKSLIRLGLSLHVPDARVRINQHLQDNYDRYRLERMGLTR